MLRKAFRALSRSVALAAGLMSGAAVAQVQGVSDTEIILGTHQDLSGPIASIGGAYRDGLIFAAEEINASGGINGRRIRLVIADNGYDPKKAVLATQKLLTQDKVFAMIATLGSATSAASMPLALDRGVPFLFPASSSDEAFTPFHPLKFAVTPPYAWQTRAGVQFAYETLGKRRFGILYQDDDTGLSTLRAVEAQLAVYQGQIAERASFKRGEFDFSSQIARLKAANVDVVMLGGNTREAAAAEIEMKKQVWQVDVIAPQGASPLSTIKLGGAAVEGLYCTVQFLSSAQDETPELKTIKDRFKARFGHDYQDGVNTGYFAMMLFAEGARNAGRDLTPQSLSRGLENVKNFTTVFAAPPITYGPKEHAPSRGTYIIKAQGDRFVKVVGPIEY